MESVLVIRMKSGGLKQLVDITGLRNVSSDDEYVIMPNQQGISEFDLEDALTSQKEYMCSKDMQTFIEKNHLNLNMVIALMLVFVFGSMMIVIILITHQDHGHYCAILTHVHMTGIMN